MRILLPAFSALLLLTSCQVPSSVSKEATSPLATGELKVALPPLFAGLEAPTWGAAPPKEETPPAPGWTGPVDDTYTRVKTSKIKATFYVVGDMVKYSPDLLKRMVDEGHEIGNHTVSHGTLSRMSDEALLRELRAAHDQIMEACGVAPISMRPPGGAIKRDQKELMLRELGYPTILWSVDPEDWKRPGPAVVTSRLVNGASPGGILLVHDLHKPTVDAMPSTFDQLLAMGYEFVTISELIKLDEAPAERGAEEARKKAEAAAAGAAAGGTAPPAAPVP